MIGKKSVKKRSHQETVLPLETTQQRQTGESQEEFDEEEDKSEKAEETGKYEIYLIQRQMRTQRRTVQYLNTPLVMFLFIVIIETFFLIIVE